MRSIQDPKKRKLIDKKPVVTSQDPDFPVSLLSDFRQRKVDWLIDNGFYERPNDGKNSKTALERGTNNTHMFITPPWFGEEQRGTPTSVSLWERKVGPNEFENYFLYEFDDPLLSDHGKAVTYSSVDDLIRDGFTHDNGEHWFKMLPDGDIVEANYVPPQLRSLNPIGPKTIDTGYSKPEIIETPPTPMLTGRQAVQVGRVAQDRENARYGQVLDKEYYWDDDLKRWQMRPVDEERLGKPFPRNDRKYRLIKASF